MIRTGHIALVICVGIAIPFLLPIALLVAGIMVGVALSQRYHGQVPPEDRRTDTTFRVGTRAPERLPARAPEKVIRG